MARAVAAGAESLDGSQPFRTDGSRAELPWYRLKPGEFPPEHSEHRMYGELVAADFIHRTGEFRVEQSGELAAFTLLPFGVVKYAGAEADLRDIPLGTRCAFFLYQDAQGAFMKAAAIWDTFTQSIEAGETLRVEQASPANGRLRVARRGPDGTPREPSPMDLTMDDQTLVWKGGKHGSIGDVAEGDDILVNTRSIASGNPARCIEIWVGIESQKLATEQQRKKHVDFIKKRGLAAWIDRVEGKKLVVTLFGDPAGLAALCKDEAIVPAQWASEHRMLLVSVANEELRTYNPPVDQQRSTVLEHQAAPPGRYGSGGVQWTIQPNLLLEGFRRGRVVRIFKDGWPVADMPYGESLYTEVPNAKPEELEASQYPFRTDFANETLPWYRLKPGEFPPYLSDHRVVGELIKINESNRAGQFRDAATGAVCEFTLTPPGGAMYVNTEVDLEEIPIGSRCRFYLYQDESGAFKNAALVTDEFTHLCGERYRYRLTGIWSGEGKLLVARQIPPVENDKGDMVKPPDVGRLELTIDEHTRVWKGAVEAKRGDLAIGDEMLVDLRGGSAASDGVCSDIWVGTESQKLASDSALSKHAVALKKRGLCAWIDSVDGKRIVATVFYNGGEKDFRALIGDDFQVGKPLRLALAGESILASDSKSDASAGTIVEMRMNQPVCYGSSWLRLVIEPKSGVERWTKGALIRLCPDPWLQRP